MYQECQVWFGAKPVQKGIELYDEDGSLLEKYLWSFQNWEAGEGSLGNMNAKIFFKGREDSALWKDMWRKLVSSYKPNYDDFEGNGYGFYDAVNTLYREGIPSGTFRDTVLYPELEEIFGHAKGFSREEDVSDFLKVASLEKSSSDNAEREGMSYHDWILEYDVDFELGTGEENAWLTKSYTNTGFNLWLGKGYQPVFRDAMIVDPCFKCILSDNARRPAEFNGDAKTDQFNVEGQQPRLQEVLSVIAARAYSCPLDDVEWRYTQVKKAFYDQHLSNAKSVMSDEEFFEFYNQSEFKDCRTIDLAGDEFIYFDNDDFTPNHLAIMLLEVMSDDVARKSVDADKKGFKEWVKPISINFVWHPPAAK